MKTKRMIALFAVLMFFSFMAVSLTGSERKEVDRPTVGLVNASLQHLFFNQIYDGAKKAAADEDVELLHVNPEWDLSKQVEMIETMIQQGVDAIVLVPLDASALLPVISDAGKAGIPVIAIDFKLKMPPVTAFIGTDNYDAGIDAGAFTVDYIKKNMGGKARIGVIGAIEAQLQNDRRLGFVEALEGERGIKVVGTVPCKNLQEEALAAAENLVTANPDMNLIYATGEPALLGAIAAVEAGGYGDRVKIVGWDLHKQAIRAIDAGLVAGVVQQNPYEEGRQGVLSALKLIAGEDVPKETMIPITMVTKDNVGDFRDLFE